MSNFIIGGFFAEYWLFLFVSMTLLAYISTCLDQNMFYNMHINSIRRLWEKPISFLQQTFKVLDAKYVAIVIIVFSMVVQCLLTRITDNELTTQIGKNFYNLKVENLLTSMLYLLSGGLLFWAQISLLGSVIKIRSSKYKSNTIVEVFDAILFSLKNKTPKTLIIITSCVILVSVLSLVNLCGELDFKKASTVLLMVKLVLMSVLDILLILEHLLIIAMILSISGLLMRRVDLLGFGNELSSVLTHTFFPVKINFGMLDLSFMILYFICTIVHDILVSVVNVIL